MARFSRIGLWGLREKQIRHLVQEITDAREHVDSIEANPIVHAGDGLRDWMFSMGASVDQVDAGFESQTDLQDFIKELEAKKTTFEETHESGETMANGMMFRALLLHCEPYPAYETSSTTHRLTAVFVSVTAFRLLRALRKV